MGAVSRPLLMLLLCPLLFGLLSRLSVRAQQQSGVGDTPYWHLAGGTAPLQLTVLPAPWSPAQLIQSEPVLTSFSARSECLCRQACLVSLRCLSYVLGPGRLCRLYRRRGAPGALTTTAAGTDYHRTYFGYDWTTDTTTTATTSDGVLMYRAGVALPGDFCTDTGECTAAVSSAHCLEHRCFCMDSTDRVCASLLPDAGAESGTVEPGAAADQTGDVTTGSGAVTTESTTPLVKTTAPSGQALTSGNATASTVTPVVSTVSSSTTSTTGPNAAFATTSATTTSTASTTSVANVFTKSNTTSAMTTTTTTSAVTKTTTAATSVLTRATTTTSTLTKTTTTTAFVVNTKATTTTKATSPITKTTTATTSAITRATTTTISTITRATTASTTSTTSAMTYLYPSIVELVVGGPTDATSTWYSSCPPDTAVSGMAQSNRTLRFIRCTPLPAGVTLDSAAVQVVSHSTWSDTLVCPAGSVVTALGCPADQASQMTWEQQPFQARLLRCVALVPRPSWSSDTCSLLTLAASQLDTRAGCPYGRLFISLHVYTEGWSVKCCLT